MWAGLSTFHPLSNQKNVAQIPGNTSNPQSLTRVTVFGPVSFIPDEAGITRELVLDQIKKRVKKKEKKKKLTDS